eukprot:8524170-Heterocapsa_arctica.AAC.1
MLAEQSVDAQSKQVHADHQPGREDAVGRREADLVSALRYGVTAGRRQLVVLRRQVVFQARVDDQLDRH